MVQASGEPVVRTKPSSDIYTVLLIIATLFVATGFVYVLWRNHQLFDSWWPTIGV